MGEAGLELQARHGLESVGQSLHTEAVVTILPKGSWRQPTLLAAVEGAQISTFGWPIGIVLNREPRRPHPTADGVQAEVAIGSDNDSLDGRRSFDFWSLRHTGDFYFLASLLKQNAQRIRSSLILGSFARPNCFCFFRDSILA